MILARCTECGWHGVDEQVDQVLVAAPDGSRGRPCPECGLPNVALSIQFDDEGVVVATTEELLVIDGLPGVSICEACGWEGAPWEHDQSTWPARCPACHRKAIERTIPGLRPGEVQVLREEAMP